MNGRNVAATLLVPFVALACAEQGQQGQQAAEQEQTAGAQDTAMAEEGAQQAQQQNRVALSAKGQSGVTGSATWTVRTDSVAFNLSLEGLSGGQQYPAHVHRGTCQSGGGVAAGLNPVTAGQGGMGEGTATLARSSFSAGQNYFVQVHLPDGTPAACGDLPADAGLAPGAGGGQGQM